MTVQRIYAKCKNKIKNKKTPQALLCNIKLEKNQAKISEFHLGDSLKYLKEEN